jgi:hypothetical protein
MVYNLIQYKQNYSLLCYRCHTVRAAGICFVATKLLTESATQRELDGLRVSLP